MFYSEPRLSPKVIQQLGQHQKYYEYAESIVKHYKEGIIPEHRVAFLTDEVNINIIAYMLYNVVTRDQAHLIMKQEGVDLVLPSRYQYFFYLDTLDVATPFQRRGIGAEFFAYATRFNLPILLQCTEDSEEYWYNHGFELLDYTWMIRG